MTATSLTDRYVEETGRRLDVAQRPEVERELRATIEDMIDGRVEAGEVDRQQVERDVLTELGDPVRLAAGYTGRPLHLIGPAVYPDWLRLLRLLLAVVPALAMTGTAIGRLVLGDQVDVGEVVAGTVVTGLTAAAHVVFWTTLGFAVVERTGATAGRPLLEWTPDQLPDRRRQVSLGDTVPSVAMLVLTAAALVWQHVDSPVSSGGEAVPLLSPDLWDFWMWWLLAVLAAELVLTLAVYRAGAWSWPLAGAKVVVGLAFAVPVLVLLAGDRLLNDQLVDVLAAGGWAQAETHLGAVTLVSVVVVTVWDAVEAVAGARRAERGRTVEV